MFFLVQRGTAALVLAESLFDEPAPVANGPAIDVDTELGSYLDEQERTVVAPLTEALCRVETVCDEARSGGGRSAPGRA